MNVKLSDAFELQMGKTPARKDESFWGGTHKWISIADLGNSSKFISDTKECISDEGVMASGIRIVPKGTVIMSFKLSIGKVAITSEDMYTNEAIMALIDRGVYEVDTNYLYHLCIGYNWTEGTNKAVMGLTLNKATLSEKIIYLPLIDEQRKIAKLLDSLDEIIANRGKAIEQLEDLVKSRFVEMFGDPIENPIGWDVVTVGDLVTEVRYGTSSPAVEGGKYPYLRMNNLTYDGHIDLSDLKYIDVSDEEKEKCVV